MTAYESIPNDSLIAGMVQPLVTQSILINTAVGAIFDRGTVMARTEFTADGTWVCTIVDSAAVGEEDKIPVGVLADVEVDATVVQQRATIYVSGEFNRAALKFGGTDTIVNHEETLNTIGLITKRVIG
jgi:hypothetical protein